MFTGIVIVFANIFAALVFALFLILQYYFIILSEETFLKEKYGEIYVTYCRQVRRILPTFKNYKGNQNPFSLKKVIYKENDSIFNLLMMFLLVLLYKEWVLGGRINYPALYLILAGILAVLYLTVKIIKKRKRS